MKSQGNNSKNYKNSMQQGMVVEKYQCRDSVTISVDAVVYYQVNSWSEIIKPAEIALFNDNAELLERPKCYSIVPP